MRKPKAPDLLMPYDVAVKLFRYHIACGMLKRGHRFGDVLKQIDAMAPTRVKSSDAPES